MPSLTLASPASHAGTKASPSLDDMVVLNDGRGMRTLLDLLRPSPAICAARAILNEKKRLLHCTGFPVNGHPENDGPPGAIVLALALRQLHREFAIVSWPDALKGINEAAGRFESVAVFQNEAPIALDGAVVTIEICGKTGDGAYYNASGADITAKVPWFEQSVGTHALVSIGDGGNEFGMGSAPSAWFDAFAVKRPVSSCDVLVAAQVSNWGALAVVAALSLESGKNLLPSTAYYETLLARLATLGFVDGFTGLPAPTEDGLPTEKSLSVLEALHSWVSSAGLS